MNNATTSSAEPQPQPQPRVINIPLRVTVHGPNGEYHVYDYGRDDLNPFRERHRLRGAVRRIMNALPGGRTRPWSRATQGSPTSSEPASPTSQGFVRQDAEPIFIPPILPNAFVQSPPPTMPLETQQPPPSGAHPAHPQMENHQLPPGWMNQSFQMQMPQPQLDGRNVALDPPINPQCGCANCTEHIRASQPMADMQRGTHHIDMVSEPRSLGELLKHGYRESGTTVPSEDAVPSEPRPPVPKRSSTIHSFPTIVFGPKRHSVDSRRSSFHPQMSSRFSTNTSVLEPFDGERSRSQSLEDTAAVPVTDSDQVQTPGVQKTRVRRNRDSSQLRVSFSAEPSQAAGPSGQDPHAEDVVVSTETSGDVRRAYVGLEHQDVRRSPSPSSSECSECSECSGQATAPPDVSDAEWEMLLQHRFANRFSIGGDIPMPDPRVVLRVMCTLDQLTMEKDKAEEKLRRLEGMQKEMQGVLRRYK